MKVLSVEEYGAFVGARRGLIVVRKGREKIAEVSPANLDYVFLSTRGVSASLDFLELMVSHAVPVFLSRHGRPVAVILPFSHRNHAETVKRQVEAQKSHLGAEAAQKIIYAKLRNQARLLTRHANHSADPPALLDAAQQIRDAAEQALYVDADTPQQARPSLMAIEASAAKLYWDAYSTLLHPDWGFKGRVKRGACDPVNMALNYLYALLASHTWVSILRSGLDPWIGLLHTDNQRRPALVYDLMEPFRPPAVDHLVAKLHRKPPDPQQPQPEEPCTLPKQHRALLQAAFWRHLDTPTTAGNRKMPLSDAILYHSRLLARYLQGQALYKPYIWR